MNASQKCIALIRDCEGFRAKPYICPAGVPTIGYGSTRYADGRKVKLSDLPITMDDADGIMIATLKPYEAAVNRYVRVSITQDQFDALVSFAYNVGTAALRTSTLLAKLNNADYNGADLEFLKWVHGAGRVLPGLVKRRELERALFRSVYA